jgi:Cu2+-exporting ATPase
MPPLDASTEVRTVETEECPHCGLPSPQARFCCAGCQAAFQMVQALGLGRYYAERMLDPAARPPRPEPTAQWDLERYVIPSKDDGHEVTLAVDGLQCGACVWLIESVSRVCASAG